MPCSVIIAGRNINFLIDYKCPQCGAPATLEESERLFTCEFCKVKSYLVAPGGFHYHFESKAPADKKLVYFPFWRMKGMGFSAFPNGVQNHYLDVSHQAVMTRHFPFSLGIRGQTLKLQFVTPETQGHFIKPVQALSEVKAIVNQHHSGGLSQSPLYETVVGETASLIYSPFYVDEMVYDAITNEPLSSPPDEDFSINNFETGKPEAGISFIPTLCPNCNWDLEGEKDSLVLHCRNCSTAWNPEHDGLKRIHAAHLPTQGDDVVYVPVWRITADVAGVDLSNYADLVRLANLPKVVQADMKDQPFYFWVMAIRLSPQVFLNLSIRITETQMQDELAEKLPEGRLLSVNLSPMEAADSLKLIISDIIRPRIAFSKISSGLKINPHKARLVYLPFRDKGHELIQEQYNFSFNKDQLKLLSNH